MRLHGWSLQYQILGISSLVLSLLVGTVLYVKRRSDVTLPPVAVSRASHPSEISIFQISSSHSKKYPKLEDDEAQSIEKKPRKSNRRDSLAASEFSIGSPSYGSFTTYERIPTKNCQGSRMMAEDNFDELASPVTSVKNDSMAEDNTDELVSPVTSVKNDSMAENNVDELVSPVTSVKNDSARGNTKRQSTRKLNALDSRQDVISQYLRDSTSSCHDFESCTDLGRRGKNGTLVKQKLSTPPGSVLGEKKKVTGVEQKPSTSLGSMLGEAKKRTVVMQKTSTTSGSNQSDAKKGILVKQKLSTPSVNILEEGKKVNEVYQKSSAPQESVLKDEMEVTMVEKKPFSSPGCMEGGIDEVTVFEQKLFTPPWSMLEEGKKEVVVN
ncbi:hypothetical protein CQW23_31891 [Capsicum baccatum]|uniref:Uncharacterized protein n=1 Tax=Capsicum baccatum TaxID=33114 RepID=A0A2G2V6C9_CAPBA|nr:hypothetical protein CQW23_31891 [Capsicum baccatum]